MKYSVWPETNAKKIPAEATELHLARPLGLKKLQALCANRPIEKVSCSDSSFRRLKSKTMEWLKKQGIEIQVQAKSGRPLKIPLHKMQEVVELVKDHRSYREIEKTLEVPKSTAHYLVRYAHRDRIKQNGTTVFLD